MILSEITEGTAVCLEKIHTMTWMIIIHHHVTNENSPIIAEIQTPRGLGNNPNTTTLMIPMTTTIQGRDGQTEIVAEIPHETAGRQIEANMAERGGVLTIGTETIATTLQLEKII